MMRESSLKTISENLEKLMNQKAREVSAKTLSQKADVSYSTLAPILKGERDFGVTKLLAIAEALNVTPNDILTGAFKLPTVESATPQEKQPPRYLASLVPGSEMTRCRIYDTQSQCYNNGFLPFSVACTETPFSLFEKIKSGLTSLSGQELHLHQVALYVAAISCEFIEGRNRIQAYGDKECYSFYLEPDWQTIHRSTFLNQNGISIVINNGYIISYSTDYGETVQRKQGYGYPISDTAGNIWLGVQAIRHAIDVREGLEPKTLLSDRVSSLTGFDLTLLAIEAYKNPGKLYRAAATIVKELSVKDPVARKLIDEAFTHIWERIQVLDREIGSALPIAISGDLAYLYADMLPSERYLPSNFIDAIEQQLAYSIEFLKKPTNLALIKEDYQ